MPFRHIREHNMSRAFQEHPKVFDHPCISIHACFGLEFELSSQLSHWKDFPAGTIDYTEFVAAVSRSACESWTQELLASMAATLAWKHAKVWLLCSLWSTRLVEAPFVLLQLHKKAGTASWCCLALWRGDHSFQDQGCGRAHLPRRQCSYGSFRGPNAADCLPSSQVGHVMSLPGWLLASTKPTNQPYNLYKILQNNLANESTTCR